MLRRCIGARPRVCLPPNLDTRQINGMIAEDGAVAAANLPAASLVSEEHLQRYAMSTASLKNNNSASQRRKMLAQ